MITDVIRGLRQKEDNTSVTAETGVTKHRIGNAKCSMQLCMVIRKTKTVSF